MIAAAESAQVIAPAKPPANVNPIEILQRTVSASRLNCWLQCRLKFFFRYVEQIAKPPTAALHVGGVVHVVLKAWNMARWKRQPFQIEQFQTLFETHWQEQPVTLNWDGEEPAQKTTAWSVLEMYFAQTPIQAHEMPEAVEVPMETDLSPHGLPTLIGVLDLVRAGGRIVDFKSTGKTPNQADAAHQNGVQMACYSVLYREATGRQEAGRELHHLVKTKTPKLVITELGPMIERQQVRLFRLMDSYVEGLAREDFVPSPGFACGGCEYFGNCQNWC